MKNPQLREDVTHMQAHIAVISGKDAGRVLPLDGGEVVLEHCVIAFEGDHHHLRMLDGLNGAKLNNEAVTGTHVLRHGDRIQTGGTQFVFLAGDHHDTSTAEPVERLRVRRVFLEWAEDLLGVRDSASIRELVATLIFSVTPAGRGGVFVDHSFWGRDREGSGESFVPLASAIELFNKDGRALLATVDDKSVICVPLDKRDRRMGFIYAEGPAGALHSTHVTLLAGAAANSALGFQLAAYIEQLESHSRSLEKRLDSGGDLLGESAAITELTKTIRKAAPAGSSVLISGETGTGKELVARAIHKHSKRSAGLFVALNCAALPEALLESELFGYEKGAFTGASSRKKGQFEVADGGTLFLDEVGELPLTIQAKLLRVTQERELQRIGGTQPIRVDIRLIAATNRDLETAVAKGQFREDLYYRLKVVEIRTPALRERPQDIPLLARHFVERYGKKIERVVRGISEEAEAVLMNYDWPGNVRELQNVIERAVVLGSTDLVLPADLPDLSQKHAMPASYDHAVDAFKRGLLLKQFAIHHGDYKKVATALGLNLSYLYRLVQNLHLNAVIEEFSLKSKTKFV